MREHLHDFKEKF